MKKQATGAELEISGRIGFNQPQALYRDTPEQVLFRISLIRVKQGVLSPLGVAMEFPAP